MLQVYDRVLPSRSFATLAGLSVILLAAYLLQGYLDAARSRMLARIGALFDATLQKPIYEAVASLRLKGGNSASVMQPVRDIEHVRAFLSGMGPTAFLDMPWIPIFLLALFVFHPLIGLAATVGAGLIVGSTLLAERQSKRFVQRAVEIGTQRAALADSTMRNMEVIHSLGMRSRLTQEWCRLNQAYIAETLRMRDVEASIGTFAKVLRYILQSSILGIGAALVIAEQASAGIMIASSIMMGRALAPIEIVLGTWKQLVSARAALARLSDTLRNNALPPAPAIALPRPAKSLCAQNVSVSPPGSARFTVRNASFELAAGTGMALLGASGSGKSSLARALVGIPAGSDPGTGLRRRPAQPPSASSSRRYRSSFSRSASTTSAGARSPRTARSRASSPHASISPRSRSCSASPDVAVPSPRRPARPDDRVEDRASPLPRAASRRCAGRPLGRLLHPHERVRVRREPLVRRGHGATMSRVSRAADRPDLLGDVRHHRMEQRQQPLERGERGRLRVGVRRAAA